MGKALPEKWIDEKESHRCLPGNLICETKNPEENPRDLGISK